MTMNKLKMNNDKTEIMACGTNAKRKQVNVDSVDIGGEAISLSNEVKDLARCFYRFQYFFLPARFSFKKELLI